MVNTDKIASNNDKQINAIPEIPGKKRYYILEYLISQIYVNVVLAFMNLY